MQWAADLHRGQRRDGKDVPYLSHVIAVSSLVWGDGGSDSGAAALVQMALTEKEMGQLRNSTEVLRGILDEAGF